MTDEEKLAYYEEAMRKGLQSRLIPHFFTTIGKMKVILLSITHRASSAISR
jgi:hypothetical protein